MSTSASIKLAQEIKRLAIKAGFASVGITSAEPLDDGWRYEQWLKNPGFGQMNYLARNVDLRLDPAKLVQGTRSIISLAWAYGSRESRSGLVARYARGGDYHKLIKARCREIIDGARLIDGGFAARAFVDSAPVLERSIAARAGVGWIGKNTCLIVPSIGSYVLLAEIFCNIELPQDAPISVGCGDCQECVKACPGCAIGPAGVDPTRCLSYLTIEHTGQIDPAYLSRIDRTILGCHACQEACPHNAHSPAGDQADDHPFSTHRLEEIIVWTLEDWKHRSALSAAERVAYPQLLRNAVILAANTRRKDLAKQIENLREIVGSAVVDWALSKLR